MISQDSFFLRPRPQHVRKETGSAPVRWTLLLESALQGPVHLLHPGGLRLLGGAAVLVPQVVHLLQFGLRLLESGSIFNEGVTPVKEGRAEIVAPATKRIPREKCLSIISCLCPCLWGKGQSRWKDTAEPAYRALLGIRCNC